jgi:hypothetical protein
MAARTQSLHRKHVPLSVTVLTLLLVVLMAQGVEARVYTNAAAHYHLTVPDGWNESNGSGGVTFTGPMSGFVAAQIAVGSTTNTSAKNDEAYLNAEMTASCNQVKALFNGTYVVSPHTFTTTSGRLAGECTIDYNVFGIEFRDRIVAFVSDQYDLVYSISMIDNKTVFPTRTSTWDEAVNSFTVEGETTPPGGTSSGSMLSGMMLYAVIGVVVLVVVVLAAVMMMRKKKAGAAPPPPPPGQQPPLP